MKKIIPILCALFLIAIVIAAGMPGLNARYIELS